MSFGKDLSFEEIYIDKTEEPTVIDDERDNLGVRFLAFLMLLPFVILVGRLYFLQSMHGAEYKALAEGNKLRSTPTFAPRGLILDANGKTIAGNLPSFELDIVPADLPKDRQILDADLSQVATILGKDKSELASTILAADKKSYQNLMLVQNIPKDQALILLSRASEFPGFDVLDNPIRDYKDPEVFSHVVGYTGKITQDELDSHPDQGYMLNDYIGKTGLEIEYENYLRGIVGQRQIEIDAQGNYKKTLAEVPSSPGENIKLNIDYDLQKVIYDSLKKVLDSHNMTKGAAVATDPKTGKVLALVSFPSFDNNLFAQGISQTDYSALINNKDHPLLNRVIAGQYPPGSTVKPMMAMAGLSEGVITPETQIKDDGVIRVGNFTFYGYEHSGLGIMNVYSAIARSSDIYFYTLGGGRAGTNIAGLGPDRIAEWFRKFHVGSALGIDLPGEKNGLAPDPSWKQKNVGEQWYLGDTYHYSIGQGFMLVTPLQMNSWTATIANGGTVYQPYILDSVLDKDGKAIKQMQPHVLSQGQFDPKWIKVVQDGMRQTVTQGTARSLQSVPMPISGKTGSAQFDPKDLTRTHAWFTSFAPSDDPQIALTVLVEGAGEGGTYSVPVTKDVMNWFAANRWKK